VSEREQTHGPAVAAPAVAAPARQDVPRTPAELALRLQRTAGNAATQRALARLIDPRARTAATGQDDSALTYQRHTGPAFVRAAGEHASGVDESDIRQGLLGDCYFLSPLMATARINPARVRRLIRGPVETTKDGRRIFEVDLYQKRWIGEPSRQTYRVDDRFVTEGDGSSRYAKHGDIAVAGPEIWVMLLEKAWAAKVGGYDKAHSGRMSDGLTAVTGSDTDSTEIADEDDADIFEDISEAVGEGRPTTISTKDTFSAKELAEATKMGRFLVAQHAYNVAGVDAKAKTIHIMNPHGGNHLRDFPLSRVRWFFDWYSMTEDPVR
jgi:hypothetical protein